MTRRFLTCQTCGNGFAGYAGMKFCQVCVTTPTCATCGKAFTPRRVDQRYCSKACNRGGKSASYAGPTEFVGVDGESIVGYCHECQCARFNSSGLKCRCGHHKDDHEPLYVLLACGADQLENPAGLGWEEMFEFLYSHVDPNRRRAFVGYYLGFDYTYLTRGFPEKKGWSLWSEKGRARRRYVCKEGFTLFHPVDVKGDRGWWEVEVLGQKRLSIRPACGCRDAISTWGKNVEDWAVANGATLDKKGRVRFPAKHPFGPKPECSHQPRPWMHICDTGPLFQQSFLKTIDPANWPAGKAPCTDAEFAKVSAGKNRRGVAVLDQDMRDYTALEVDILARVMSMYEGALAQLGIRLQTDDWYGPGAVAARWVSNRRARRDKKTGKWGGGHVYPNSAIQERVHEDNDFNEVYNAAYGSYFGGWFEVFLHGKIGVPVYEYDLASAYPHQIAQLPCPVHAKWEPCTTWDPKDKSLRLVYARLSGSDPYIGVHLHRHDGSKICRPHETEGWIWSHELAAIERAGLVDKIVIEDGWRMSRKCPKGCPLAEIATLYQQRLDAGKKTPLGRAIKLLMNSLYGKFAQAVGAHPWQNMIWASLITAGTRAMILDAIATHPEGAKAVAMVATDAVYFTSPHPGLTISDYKGRREGDPAYEPGKPALGSWEPKVYNGLVIFKPGVYWADGIPDEAIKSRGIRSIDLAPHKAKVEQGFDRLVAKVQRAGGSLRTRESDWPQITFPVEFAVVSARLAAARGKWSTAGHQCNGEPRSDSAWPAKRGELIFDKEGSPDSVAARSTVTTWDPDVKALRTGVPPGGGSSLRYSLVATHASDIVDAFGTTPEGALRLVIREALGVD